MARLLLSHSRCQTLNDVAPDDEKPFARQIYHKVFKEKNMSEGDKCQEICDWDVLIHCTKAE